MLDLNKIRGELARLDNNKFYKSDAPTIGQRVIRPCPRCGCADAWGNIVKKEGDNQGRPFLSCPKCDAFFWLDLGECRKCGSPLSEWSVKKEGRNKGRRFRSCGNHCKGSFTWV